MGNMSRIKEMSRINKKSQTSVEECRPDGNDGDDNDLLKQRCKLVIARKLTGYILVSGGGNYGDAYLQVQEYNKRQPPYKYILVGGAAPTVTPMGWTFAGGLSSTIGSRLWGLGVDQVIQIEMVLPNGVMVRFGPTETDDDDRFLYPTTTKVSGRCATSNSDLDSFGNYLFERCSDDTDINFMDLWFAMLGGGGGTYGIVTAMSIQLQEYKPLEYVAYDIQGCFSDPDLFSLPNIDSSAIIASVLPPGLAYSLLSEVQSDFIVDFLLDPTK